MAKDDKGWIKFKIDGRLLLPQLSKDQVNRLLVWAVVLLALALAVQIAPALVARVLSAGAP